MFTWLAVLLNSADFVRAEDKTPFQLDEIRVVAGRTGPSGLGVGYDRSVIDPEKFISPGKRQTVIDLLDKMAGIDVARADPVLADDRDVVKVRGLGGRRILVRIDGRPVRNAGGFGDTLVDWTSLSLNGIERIELYRGGHSAVFGETIGGTINIVTKKRGKKQFEASVAGQYSEYDTVSGDTGLCGTFENGGYFLAAGVRSSNGYLKNGEYEILDIAGRLSFDLSFGGVLDLSYQASGQDKRLFTVNDPAWPGYDSSHPRVPVEAFGSVYSANFSGGDDYYDRTTQCADAAYRRKWGLGDLTAHAYLTRERRDAVLYRFSGNAFYDYAWDVSYEDIGWIVQNRLEWGDSHRTAAGFDGRFSYGQYDMESPYRSSGAEKGKWLEHVAGYIEDTWRFADNWSLTLGLRYDRVELDLDMSDYEGVLEQWSPKSGLEWQATPNLIGFFYASKAFRVPTAMEYGWLEFPTGQNLDSETALQFEAGTLAQLGRGNALRLTAYYYDIDNYVVFNNLLTPAAAVATGRPVEDSLFNAEYLKLAGIEIEADFCVAESLSGYFNYAYQKGDLGPMPVPDEEARIDVYQLPRHKANLGLEWRPLEGMKVSGVLRLVDDRKTASNEKIGGFVTADLAVTKSFLNGKAKCEIFAINLFDQWYEEVYKVPARERTFGGRLIFSY